MDKEGEMRLGHGQRALAVGAHPDDAEFGCYGLLQRFEEASVLVLSAGERGGPPDVRRKEAAEAAGTIGASLLVEEHPDTAIAATTAIAAVEREIARVRPHVVLCPARNDQHQDHATVAHACYVATRGFAGVLLGYLTPSAMGRFAPQVIVGLTDEEWTTKTEALAAHRSQAHRAYLAADYLETTARYWAQQVPGVGTRAEPFELVRWTEPGEARGNQG